VALLNFLFGQRPEGISLPWQYESSRDSINDFLLEHSLFFKIEVVNTILSIVSVALYIAATYMEPDDPKLSSNSGFKVPAELVEKIDLVDNAINFFFLADFLFKLFLASAKAHHLPPSCSSSFSSSSSSLHQLRYTTRG